MPDTTEVLLARIDERTRQMHLDIKEIKGHNDEQDARLGKLEGWRNGIVGGVSAIGALLALLFKLG
jgi:hypothetical protein